MGEPRPWTLTSTVTTPLDLLGPLGCSARVLEVGCGRGDEARILADAGFEVLAIDSDGSAIDEAIRLSEHAGNPLFRHQDFARHAYQDEFDAVYERGVFHNIKSARDRSHFVSRIARALKPQGLWISIIGCADDVSANREHGCLFLTHVIPAVERYFEVLLVERRPYGTTVKGANFDAWYLVLRRRH